MSKAEEILDKHLENRSWTKTVPKYGNLYNTLLDAVSEALTIPVVVGRSEQLPQMHGLIKCECGKVYDVDIESNCPSCGN